MAKKAKIKKLCGWILALTFIIICQTQPVKTILTLPSHVNIIHGNPHYLPFAYPNILNIGLNSKDIVNVSTFENEANNKIKSGFSFEPITTGEAKLQVKLLGIIPIQTININVLPQLNFIAGGHTLGVYMHTDGILVTGLMKMSSGNSNISPAEKAGIRTGDYILKINGYEIINFEDLDNVINRESQKSPLLTITIRKGDSIQDVNVKAIQSDIDGKYKIGVYGKNSISGIGVLTYIDPVTKTYGALGHPVSDPDSKSNFKFRAGSITMASVTSIEKSLPGIPGQKNAIAINRNDLAGSINKNGQYGIYGDVLDDAFFTEKTYPVALSSSIQEGKATILTVVDGTDIEEFEIKIVRRTRNYSGDTRGMVIEITDKRLLDHTGGIVQGMSGSPILQNGKIIGAVTHVFLNNPKRGYGCYIENMVYESELLNIQLRQISTNIWQKRRNR